LVPSLYNLGRIDEANLIHEFYVDNNACPNQMLFINQAWEYARARNADEYRKDNQKSMKKLYETCLELSSPYFTDDMEAYDFGCGSGLFGETLKPHVSKQVGIDFSSTFAKSIRPNVYDDIVIVDGLEIDKLNLPKVDLVVAGAVIQYFGLIQPILARLVDLIKVGGLMIFDTISKLDEGKCPSSLASVQAYSHNKNYVIETAQTFGLKSETFSNGNFRNYQSDIFVFRKK
jgi:predicted TPR repeat methyltransferase